MNFMASQCYLYDLDNKIIEGICKLSEINEWIRDLPYTIR